MSQLFCGKCGAKINENDKFCGKCASPVKTAPSTNEVKENIKSEPDKLCECGAKLDVNAKFCGTCGKKPQNDVIKNNVQEKAPAPTKPESEKKLLTSKTIKKHIGTGKLGIFLIVWFIVLIIEIIAVAAIGHPGIVIIILFTVIGIIQRIIRFFSSLNTTINYSVATKECLAKRIDNSGDDPTYFLYFDVIPGDSSYYGHPTSKEFYEKTKEGDVFHIVYRKTKKTVFIPAIFNADEWRLG